jgi:hypothetical protein
VWYAPHATELTASFDGLSISRVGERRFLICVTRGYLAPEAQLAVVVVTHRVELALLRSEDRVLETAPDFHYFGHVTDKFRLGNELFCLEAPTIVLVLEAHLPELVAWSTGPYFPNNTSPPASFPNPFLFPFVKLNQRLINNIKTENFWLSRRRSK